MVGITFREWRGVKITDSHSWGEVPGSSDPSEKIRTQGSSKLLRPRSQNTRCLDIPQICGDGNCSGCLTRGAETWVLALPLVAQASDGVGQPTLACI